jgi:hypothetical protein
MALVAAKEMNESINLMPSLLHVEVIDDSDEARYTCGEMWFTENYRDTLLELATAKEHMDAKVLIHRRIYNLQGVYFNNQLERVKATDGSLFLKIKFGAEDLVSINEWTVPAKNTKI